MEFLELKYNAFGLDVNDSFIKLIKLRKSGRKFRVCSYNKFELKPGIVQEGVVKDEKSLANAIRQAYLGAKGRKIKTKYVVLSLPEEESFIQVIQMPRMTPKELKSAVVFEAENYIPLPIEDVYIDFQPISFNRGDSEHIDVLVVATPKRIVDAYVSCVKLAGLTPVCIEVESQSIVRALVKDEKSDQPVVLIDMGESSVDFIVFYGGSIRFTCSVQISEAQLMQSISDYLKVDISEAKKLKDKYGLTGASGNPDKEAERIFEAMSVVMGGLVSEIRKYINFYQEHATHEHLPEDGKIKKIVICGTGANLKGMPEFLAKETGIPVEVGDPFINALPIKKPKNVDFFPYAVSIGLALGAIKLDKQQ